MNLPKHEKRMQLVKGKINSQTVAFKMAYFCCFSLRWQSIIFWGKVGLNLASDLVSSSCSQKTTC